MLRRPLSATVAFVLLAAISALSSAAGRDGSAEKETPMPQTARGTFDVKLSPLPPVEGEPEIGAGRMAIDKTFHGELEGTSQGQMLALRTATEGSAGYVALERVKGKLAGRSGSFVLQHSSTMNRGEPRQSITVLPDSGTGELEGLAGSMVIEIEEGEHRYVFEYSF